METAKSSYSATKSKGLTVKELLLMTAFYIQKGSQPLTKKDDKSINWAMEVIETKDVKFRALVWWQR